MTAPVLEVTSPAQERLWVVDRLSDVGSAYTISLVVRWDGELDVELFRRAVGLAVQRHGALRTSFAEVNGKPVQVVHPAVRMELEPVDLRPAGPEEALAEARRLFTACAAQPFDLKTAPLMRMRLVRVAADEWLLGLFVHH